MQRPFPSTHLKQLMSWMGRYETIAPFELLHFVLDHWENFGFIDQQCDAGEFLSVMHQLSNAPDFSEKLTVCFNIAHLEHEDVRCGSTCSLQEMVDLMLKDFSLVPGQKSEKYCCREILTQSIQAQMNFDGWSAKLMIGMSKLI